MNDHVVVEIEHTNWNAESSNAENADRENNHIAERIHVGCAIGSAHLIFKSAHDEVKYTTVPQSIKIGACPFKAGRELQTASFPENGYKGKVHHLSRLNDERNDRGKEREHKEEEDNLELPIGKVVLRRKIKAIG